MGVAEGDGRLVRISSQSVGKGTLTVLAVGVFLGFAIPSDGLTGEMIARTHPAPLDVAVALASGAAGAYALCRRGAASALPGVAIAVSLVPPLTTVGIAAAAGQEQAAAGASLLFLLNLTAVSFASTVVFLWIGFRPQANRVGRLRLFARGFGGLTLLLFLVSLPVVWLTWHAGSGPSIADQVGSALTLAVAETEDAELRDFEISISPEGVLSVRAEVASAEALDHATVMALQEAVSTRVGQPVEFTLDHINITRVGPELSTKRRD
jgi:hypothetical protein